MQGNIAILGRSFAAAGTLAQYQPLTATGAAATAAGNAIGSANVAAVSGDRFTATIMGTALMVAGGTGFAPIKSILDHIVRQKLQRTVHLYWGARTQDGIYAADVLARWAQQSPGWVIHPLLSNATDVSAWTGRVGFVHEAVRADFKDLSDWDVYACGGMPMVTALRDVCSKLGLSDANFYSDAFVG